jgi:hypothetical protein
MKTLNRLPLLAVILAAALLAPACVMDDGDTVEGTQSEISGRPYFEVFQGRDSRYYFHLVATNHEIILQSQGYSTRTGSLGGVLSVLDHAGTPSRYDLLQASNGDFYFNLQSDNGEVIGTSELYSSKQAAQQGIEAVDTATGDYLAFLASRRGARFTVFEGADGRYFFNLRAKNGQVVLQSQGYTSEAAAYNGTFSVANYGRTRSGYDIRQSASGAYYFNVKAENGQVVGTSQTYSSKSNANRGRDAVIAVLPGVELL